MKIKKFICLILCLSLILPTFAFDVQIPTGVAPISVSVTGYIKIPGVYRLTPSHRVSDAISFASIDPNALKVNEQALNTKTEVTKTKQVAADSLKAVAIAMRSVILIRDGKEQSYDLQAFMRKGDLAQNPALKDGDVILLNPVYETISILGAVSYPDEYEFLPGDKLSDLISLAKGFRSDADLSRVMIYRYRNNMKDFDQLNFDLRAYRENPAILDIPLNAYDRISIPTSSQFRQGRKVKVSGYVSSPGEYLINENSTLYDLLELCGGPSANADLSNAIILNKALYEQDDPEFDRLSELTLSQMTPLEYNYMRSKVRQLKGKYSLAINETWESKGEKHNPVLKDGDHLFVPERMNVVWVSGQVRNPGLIPFVEGKDYRYYVEAAGGYTNNRRFGGSRIIRASSGNWVKPTKNLAIRSGDVVFIPESTDRDIWLDVKDIVLLTSQVITIVIGFRNLTTK